MKYENATDDEIKKAQAAHNLFISGVFLFNLMGAPAVLALKIGMIGLLIPLLLTGVLIAYLYLRSAKTTTWFVDMHWKTAFARGKLLLLGYSVTTMLIFLAWIISISVKDHNMGHIILTALTRVALVPTVIMVLVTAVMEFGSFAQAGKREVPDKLAAKFPPPAA